MSSQLHWSTCSTFGRCGTCYGTILRTRYECRFRRLHFAQRNSRSTPQSLSHRIKGVQRFSMARRPCHLWFGHVQLHWSAYLFYIFNFNAQIIFRLIWQMRDLVRSKSYRLRKMVDDFLYRNFPNFWIPLYNSVSFSHMPYQQCIDNRKWQDKVNWFVA